MAPEKHSAASDPYRAVARRDLLTRWGPAALVATTLAGTGALLGGREGRHRPPDDRLLGSPRDWRVDASAPGRLVTTSGSSSADNVRRALVAVGGIERFVRRGDKVAIKPNCAWDRTPEQAANTDPALVAELVRLCLAAGAASVWVVDSTCHDPDRSFERSGIAPAARAAGARVGHQSSGGVVRLDLGGTQLGPWDVLKAIAEADRLINVPIVKHHGLARVTVGMKNWIGAVTGPRSAMHQRLPQVTAELGAAFRPTLTVVDATRVMVSGGPTGGSLSSVRVMNQLAVATDPVAADAWGASLLGVGARDLSYLDIAMRLGLGSTDWQAIREEA
jgi:uncharacterized protein (DUF362 family)